MSDPQRALIAEIARRNRDYTSGDIERERAELVKLWREAHPEAASEPPSAKRPLLKVNEGVVDDIDRPEVWVNDIYQVMVRRATVDPVFGSASMIQIGIHTHSGTARHDWREFQEIKNQVAGDECEAFELYPAESRLLDPSNYYTLWCFPGLKRGIKVGKREGRWVLDADEALAPQRGFGEALKPGNS
jgi:hypothetical protein